MTHDGRVRQHEQGLRDQRAERRHGQSHDLSIALAHAINVTVNVTGRWGLHSLHSAGRSHTSRCPQLRIQNTPGRTPAQLSSPPFSPTALTGCPRPVLQACGSPPHRSVDDDSSSPASTSIGCRGVGSHKELSAVERMFEELRRSTSSGGAGERRRAAARRGRIRADAAARHHRRAMRAGRHAAQQGRHRRRRRDAARPRLLPTRAPERLRHRPRPLRARGARRRRDGCGRAHQAR